LENLSSKRFPLCTKREQLIDETHDIHPDRAIGPTSDELGHRVGTGTVMKMNQAEYQKRRFVFCSTLQPRLVEPADEGGFAGMRLS
jgi:hypothetical protein